MGVACSREAMSDDDTDERDYFLYTGQDNVYIPRDVTRVRVHPSVKKIKARAFQGCTWLRTAILNEGLEEIGGGSFSNCRSLVRVDIPPAVRAINNGAFCGCSMLTTVHLDYGLEEIDDLAFCGCMSLVRIIIPPVVRVIKHGAFAECSGLTTAILNNGLEEIEAYAFHACTSLVCITIPSAVRVIDEKAFHGCSGLTNVFFCNEIEEFVSGSSMRDWWNNGVHENCLSTYCFLVQCNILERVGLILPRMWHSEIHDMLQRIPSISPEGLQSHFRFIDSKLSVYNELKDSPALLELAIWKSKITEQTDGNNIDLLNADMKMECRTDSLSMVVIIVPNVLSFLTDGVDGSELVDGELFDLSFPINGDYDE